MNVTTLSILAAILIFCVLILTFLSYVATVLTFKNTVVKAKRLGAQQEVQASLILPFVFVSFDRQDSLRTAFLT